MKVWLIADPHFNHQGMCEFNGVYGTKLRPWDRVEEMNNAMIEKWNAVVGVEDKVYILGDFVMTKKQLPIIEHLNGRRKILIKGNHDTLKLKDYTKYFYDIRAYHLLDNYVLSHIPIHPDSLGRFKGNIHGHLHDGMVRLPDGTPDYRYFNVSVENIDYQPIAFDMVVKSMLYNAKKRS